MTQEYDVIVVGSGAGGSTVAREMTRKGKKVLLLERGGRAQSMGNTLTVARILKRTGLTRSREKFSVVFGNNFGGLSNLSGGCAVPPPRTIFEPLGIDLSKEVEEARKDMWINTLPDELVGDTNLRLIEAANDAGFNWGKIENFIDPDKCIEGCSSCMLGCRFSAKWTARVYGDEAMAGGAEVKLHTNISNIIKENGKAIGVEGYRFGRKIKYYGKYVVLSSGISNVDILRKAGINEAGKGFCCDWLQFVGGVIPGMNTLKANPMTVGSMEHYENDGLVVLPVFPNWAQFAVILGFMGVKHYSRMREFWKYTGLMVKIRDEKAGELFGGVSFSKPITDGDQKKLDKGVDIIKKILKKAGAKEDSFFALKPTGAHPSAVCRIGEVVDTNLETEIENLFCCDATVFPVSLGLPTVWTIVSLGKRLAGYIDGRRN